MDDALLSAIREWYKADTRLERVRHPHQHDMWETGYQQAQRDVMATVESIVADLHPNTEAPKEAEEPK